MPKICTLFCLVDIKKFIFYLLCVLSRNMLLPSTALLTSQIAHFLLHLIIPSSHRRPDMTFAVDWTLSNNYLSIYLLIISALVWYLLPPGRLSRTKSSTSVQEESC